VKQNRRLISTTTTILHHNSTFHVPLLTRAPNFRPRERKVPVADPQDNDHRTHKAKSKPTGTGSHVGITRDEYGNSRERKLTNMHSLTPTRRCVTNVPLNTQGVPMRVEKLPARAEYNI